jgi:hypothetical protein
MTHHGSDGKGINPPLRVENPKVARSTCEDNTHGWYAVSVTMLVLKRLGF